MLDGSSMRALPLVCCLALCVGCDEPQSEPIVPAAERATPPTAADPEAAPIEPGADAVPERTERRVSVIAFDDGDAPIRLPSMRWEPVPFGSDMDENGYEPGSWPRIEHDDPEIAAWLAERTRAETLTFEREVTTTAPHDLQRFAFTLGCAALIAQDALLSLDCGGFIDGSRGNPWFELDARNFVVGDRTLERFEVADTLTAGADLDRLLRDGCLSRARAAERDAPRPPGRWTDTPQQACVDMPARAEVAIAADGLRARYLCDTMTETITCVAPVPFRALDRLVLADSPLGRALAAAPGARRIEVELPPGTAAPGEDAHGFAVTDEDEMSALLHAWRGLPEPAREGVLLVPRRHRVGVLAHPDEARAAEVARLLGHASQPTRWREAARPFVGVTRTPLHIREQRGVALIAPEGTVVIGLLGRLRGRDSSIGQRSTAVYLSVAPRVSAWAAGNLVAAHERCVPSADAFIAAMPADRHERARRTLMTSLTHVSRGGRTQPVVAFFAATAPVNRRRRGRFRMDVHERGEDCAVGRRLARVDEEGVPYAAFLTTTEARGGHPLLVLGAQQRDRIAWTIRRFGQDEELYRTTASRHDEVVVGLWEGDAYYPFVMRFDSAAREEAEPVRLRWTGEGLEPLPSP